MSELGRLVQAYRDRQKYPVADRPDRRRDRRQPHVRRQLGQGAALPSPENLRALAAEIETPYLAAFEATTTDAGDLPERLAEAASEATPVVAPEVAAQSLALAARPGTPAHLTDGSTGEQSQDPGDLGPA